MGYTAQIGGFYNVMGSLNQFFQNQVTGAGLPAFMPSAVVNFDYPQQPLTFPSFSVTHLGSEPAAIAQGSQLDPGWRGYRRVGLMEIDCWESEQRASGQAVRNVTILRDMAARVFATGAGIPILDVYGTTGTPTANGTIIRAMAAREAGIERDENPDVVRRRLIIEYNWLERVSG